MFFLAYFLESIISEYGQDFVLTELLGKNPQRGVIESCKRALNELLRFLHIVKRIQEGRPENDDPFHGSFQRIVSSVQDKKDIVGQDILIKNKKFTKELIDQIAKFLNFASLEVKPEDRQVTIKDQIATNSDSSADSGFNSDAVPVPVPNSNSDSDADSVSEVDSDSDSNDSPLFHVNSIKSNNSAFSESSKLKQEKKERKSKYSGHEERFYARQKNPNLRLKLQAKQEQLEEKLEEKLKYCQQRKSVYETLYKRYESYKDSNNFSQEELKDYEFKFKLNKKLYHHYEDYINQDNLSIMDHESRLLEYYKFKHAINKFKFDEYRSYIEKIENDVNLGTIAITDTLLRTLGYYKEKCERRYIPRLRDYKLLMEAAGKKIENAHVSVQSKSPVVDESQRHPISHTSGMDTPVTGADETVKGKPTNDKRPESGEAPGVPPPPPPPPPPTELPMGSSKTAEQKAPARVGDHEDELAKAIRPRKEALEEGKGAPHGIGSFPSLFKHPNQDKKPSGPKTLMEALRDRFAVINPSAHESEPESKNDSAGSDDEWNEDKNTVPNLPENN